MAERQSTEERQQQIAEAALQIIARDGLGKFTTAAISRVVGLAEGTIFRHFGNKQEIVLAAIERMAARLIQGFPPVHEDPIERLGIFLRRRLALLIAHPGVFRTFFADQLAQAAGEAGAAQIDFIKRQSVGFVRECLQEAAQKELLRPGLDPDVLVRVVLGTVHSFLFAPASEEPQGSPEEQAQQVWSTIETLIRR